MTRTEAIKILEGAIKKPNTKDGYLGQALSMAIKALEQEPCEDEYIKVPKKALKYRTTGMVAYNVEWLKNHFDIERAVICGVQEPKTGHWKKMVSAYDMIEGKYRMIPYTRKDEELGNPPFYICDCGNNSKKPTNYCPDCGSYNGGDNNGNE